MSVTGAPAADAGGAPAAIELGGDWSLPDRPSRPRSRPRSSRAPRIAALVTAVMLLLGGAERVRPRLVALGDLPTNGAARVALAADTAFVADRAAGQLVQRTVDELVMYGTVAAYPLAGGAPRWRTLVPQPPQELRFVPGAGVVVATSLTGPDAVMLTTALDAATGQVRWTTDSGALVDVAAGGDQGLLAGLPGAGLRWVDLGTGRTLWSRPVPLGAQFDVVPGSTGPASGLLVVSMLDGTVDVLAERTGAVIATGNVGSLEGDFQIDSSSARPAPGLAAIGRRLLVFRPKAGGPGTVSAFDLTDLRPLWTLGGYFRGYAVGCGAMICLPGDAALTAVDPDRGQMAWTSDRWTGAGPLDGDRLIGYVQGATDAMAVLAAGTGRVLAMLPGWQTVDDPDTGLPVLALRPSTVDGRAWFAALDRAGPAVLGELPHIAGQSCQATAALLACQTGHETVRVWRYRAGP